MGFGRLIGASALEQGAQLAAAGQGHAVGEYTVGAAQRLECSDSRLLSDWWYYSRQPQFVLPQRAPRDMAGPGRRSEKPTRAYRRHAALPSVVLYFEDGDGASQLRHLPTERRRPEAPSIAHRVATPSRADGSAAELSAQQGLSWKHGRSIGGVDGCLYRVYSSDSDGHGSRPQLVRRVGERLHFTWELSGGAVCELRRLEVSTLRWDPEFRLQLNCTVLQHAHALPAGKTPRCPLQLFVLPAEDLLGSAAFEVTRGAGGAGAEHLFQ